MTEFINEEEVAFLMIGSPQVKVGDFGFAVAWKNRNTFKILNFKIWKLPEYVYLLNAVQC